MRILSFICLASVAFFFSSHALTAELQQRILHCPIDVDISQPRAAERCDLDARPPESNQRVDNAQQVIRLDLINPRAEAADVSLTIRPFYLADIQLYAYADATATKIAEGGALSATGKVHQALGGHTFFVPALPGQNTYLIEIAAPGFAHISIDSRTTQKSVSLTHYQVGISLHLGMLITLTSLALLGWLLKRNTVTLRLFFVISCILVQVSLGSGAIPLALPTGLATEVAMTLFVGLVAVRVALWGWLYQVLIEPHITARWYRVACSLSYAAAAISMALYFMDATTIARLLSLTLVIGIPVLHTVAALNAQFINPRFKLGLIASLFAYNLLLVVALYLVTMHSAANDLPILITRLLDVLIPILAIAVVLLRNWATDKELVNAAQTLARQEAQLEEQKANQKEKNMLLDMLTHEIKNPLTTIGIATRSLQSQWPSLTTGAHKRFLNIQRAVDTIDQVIERCDLSTKIDDKGIEIRPSDVRPLTMIENLAASYSGNPRRFTLTGSRELTIHTDSSLLQTVLSNLLDNAFRYAPEDDDIHADIAGPDDQGVVTITMSNRLTPGDSPDPNRLFRRYYRHINAKHVGGSGLGLSLCERVMTLLGGTIEATIRDEAITFRVRLSQ